MLSKLAFAFVLLSSTAHAWQVPADPGAGTDRSDRTEAPRFVVRDLDPALAPLSLREVSVDVEVSGVVADVTLTQIWENPGSLTLDATWVFPLSTRAAVHALEMRVGDRRIQAVIKEKQQARAIFEAARQAGQRATLLEQARPNVFVSELANVRPGDVVLVEVRYVELLRPTDGVFSLVVPRVVGPRYVSAAEDFPDLPWSVLAPAERAAPEPDLAGWPITVTLRGGVPVTWAQSTSHPIELTRTDDELEVTLAEVQPDASRDFVLEYALGGEATTTGVLVHPDPDGQGGHFLALVDPPERVDPEAIPPRDYVFIVDTSGSMEGWPLGSATAIVTSIVDDLEPRDRINVLCFSGSSDLLAPESLFATPTNKDRARAFLARQRSDGGTELMPALARALAMPRDPGVARTFVLVTDGMISADRQTLDLLRLNLASANLFTVGVGDSVNRHLIESLAKAGAGEAYVAESEAAAYAIAERFMVDASAPLLTDLALTVDGELTVSDLEPAVLPTLYSSRPLVVSGRYEGRPAGELVLTGRAATGRWQARVTLAGADANPAVPLLWARERIARLSDVVGYDQADTHRAEVTELGLDYHLVTAYTSFVAVDSEQSARTHTATPDAPLDALAAGDLFVGGGLSASGSGGLGFVGDGSGGGGGGGFGGSIGAIGGVHGLGALPSPARAAKRMTLSIRFTLLLHATQRAAAKPLEALVRRRLGALRACFERAGVTAAEKGAWLISPRAKGAVVTLLNTSAPAADACVQRALGAVTFPAGTPELRLELMVRP